MKAKMRNLQVVVFILAVLSVFIIIADSIIVNFYTQEVVLDPNAISSWEKIIIIGAIILGVFFLVSMYWVWNLKGDKGRFSAGKVVTLVFGLLSFFLLVGEKAVANKVGELINVDSSIDSMMVNLQMLFIIQLIYVVLIMVELAAQDTSYSMNSDQNYDELKASRNFIAAISSIIPGLGHLYKAHYGTGIGLLVVSPFFIWAGLILGWATFGIGLLLPLIYLLLIGWHAYNLEDWRKHPAGVL